MQEHFYFPAYNFDLSWDSSDDIKDIRYNLGCSLSHDLGTLWPSLTTINNCNHFQTVHLWPLNVVGNSWKQKCQINQELECGVYRQPCLLCEQGSRGRAQYCAPPGVNYYSNTCQSRVSEAERQPLRWWNEIRNLAKFSQCSGHWGGESFIYPTWSAKVKPFLTVLTTR